MASQAHMGHATALWNPANQRYIYGIRQGIHIISLEATAAHLRRAAKVVEGVAYHGGIILFVGTREGQSPAVVRAAQLSKGCHLFERWTPGSITNGEQILKKCGLKVLDPLDKEVAGYDDKINTWKALKPDLVVVMNPLENYVLLQECGLYNIPTIGVIDTDVNPAWVTYPIPANDDRFVLAAHPFCSMILIFAIVSAVLRSLPVCWVVQARRDRRRDWRLQRQDKSHGRHQKDWGRRITITLSRGSWRRRQHRIWAMQEVGGQVRQSRILRLWMSRSLMMGFTRSVYCTLYDILECVEIYCTLHKLR